MAAADRRTAIALLALRAVEAVRGRRVVHCFRSVHPSRWAESRWAASRSAVTDSAALDLAAVASAAKNSAAIGWVAIDWAVPDLVKAASAEPNWAATGSVAAAASAAEEKIATASYSQ